MALSKAAQAQARVAAKRTAREEAYKAASTALRRLGDTGVLDPRSDDGPRAKAAKQAACEAVMALFRLTYPADVVHVADLGPYDFEADDRAADAAREDRIFGRGR